MCVCVRPRFAFLAWAAAGVKDRPGESENSSSRPLGGVPQCQWPRPPNSKPPSNPQKHYFIFTEKSINFFFSVRECSGLSRHVKSVRQAAVYDTFAAGGDSRGAVPTSVLVCHFCFPETPRRRSKDKEVWLPFYFYFFFN